MHDVGCIKEAVLDNLIKLCKSKQEPLAAQEMHNEAKRALWLISEVEADVARKLPSAGEEECQELNRHFFELVHEMNQLRVEMAKEKELNKK